MQFGSPMGFGNLKVDFGLLETFSCCFPSTLHSAEVSNFFMLTILHVALCSFIFEWRKKYDWEFFFVRRIRL